MSDLLAERFGLKLVLRRKESSRSEDYDKVASLNWGDVKPGSSKFRNADSQLPLTTKPLVGPLPSHQVSKEFASYRPVVCNVIKSKRKKKTTAAKKEQFKDSKLFKVCQARGNSDERKESKGEDVAILMKMGREQSGEEKRKRKLKQKREEAKGGNKKYLHLQAFVEKRRQRRQEREEERRREEISTIDLDAKPAEAGQWWVPDLHEQQQGRVRRNKVKNVVRPSMQLGREEQRVIRGSRVVPASTACVKRVTGSEGGETSHELVGTNEGRKTSWGKCTFYSPGKMRGGTPESGALEEERGENRAAWFGEVRRPEGWKYWADDKIEQRPAPLLPPRSPDMEYADMTANAVTEEGAPDIFSPLKDRYRRTEQQLKDVQDAHADQRNVAGGTYRCLDEGNAGFELTIRRGYKSKVLGIVLAKKKDGKRASMFESFALMRYEYFKFGDTGLRFRQSLPQETLTGFTWEGFGGNTLPLPTSDVHVYCERVDRDVHFSGGQCSRVQESPGASQLLCSSLGCGVVTWHLSRKCFRKEGGKFSEVWQESFALVTFKAGRQELIWTHPQRKKKTSRWERLEGSPQFDAYVVDRVFKQRVESVLARKCLPPYTFSAPSYVPGKQQWQEREPLLTLRQPEDSQWKFLAAVVLALHLTPGRRLQPTMAMYRDLWPNLGPDSFQEALFHLLLDCGSSNSLGNIAKSIEAHQDDSSSVSENVNKLLSKLLEILAWSGDFKLRDMAHRHELKYMMSIGDGGCYHKRPQVVKHNCIQFSLRVNKLSDEAVTVEQLKAGIDGLRECPFVEEPCRTCGTSVDRTLSLSIQHGCDPDFLTIMCDVPISFSSTDFTIPFSNSLYRVMAVVQWDMKNRRASVAREREDGWWWHGVDKRQAESFKFTAEQVAASRQFRDAAVLMAVRTSEESPEQIPENTVESAAAEGGESEGLRGVAAAISEEYMDVGGQSEELNFNPQRTSTQRDGRHGTGSEEGISVTGGERASIPETEEAGDHSNNQGSADGPSTTASFDIHRSHQCLCGFNGPLADHLRANPRCVVALRKEPALQMGGTDAQFIVKSTVVLNGCPAPSCAGLGGGHLREDLPEQCQKWWKGTGWKLMGWKGSRENAGSADIKKKIANFRKIFNLNRKKVLEQNNQIENSHGGNQVEATNGNGETANKAKCNFCPFQGMLAGHLEESKQCLSAHIEQYLQHRAHIYRGKLRLAIFDLGLACNFCPNPVCATVIGGEAVTNMKHVESGCKLFYQSEGEHLLKWEQSLSATTIQNKLRRRNNFVKEGFTDTSQIEKYQKELASMLKHVCGKCAIQGPLLELPQHWIHGPINFVTGPQCIQCLNNDDLQQELHDVMEGLRELGAPAAEHDDTLEKVYIEDEVSQNLRVVFVPAVLKVDQQGNDISDVQLHPFSTTVLVPKYPEALEDVGEEGSERANSVKKRLGQISEFFGRRHFLGPVTETLSILWRHKLAEIRVQRLSMLSSNKNTGKGKVKSRDPNCAAVKDRNPHFAETQAHCLTNTCSFSAPAQQRRSQESAARLNIIGQVRIKVQIKLIKKMATGSPLLQEIIQENMLSPHGVAPLVSLAPLVLNYLKAKTKLLVKHCITPRYTNWDLDLRFAEREWTVEMVGYVYCEEFKELNQKIARGEVSASEVAAEVRKHSHVLPTTASSIRRLTRDLTIGEERAQAMEALVRQHQRDGKPEPLSLLTMCSPAGLHVSAEELLLRERAIQLGKNIAEEVTTVEAIVEIMETLKVEGIDNLCFEKEDGRRIRDELMPFLVQQRNTHQSPMAVNKDLLLYHLLIWKTGGENMWTMAREPGESTTDAYIPELLEASGLHMSAELSSSGDYLVPQEGVVSEELKPLITNHDAWREVSLLEFVNSTLPAEKVSPARGAASDPVVPIITSKDRKLTWRKAFDLDNHSGDAVFQGEGENSYVRSSTDLRTLYEKRPPRMDRMVLTQLACEYMLIHPSKRSFEKATSSINEESQLGPDSDHLVAGTGNLAAPEAMKLTDGRIMKRRQDKKAVPILQYSGSTSKHGNQLMFSPWRHLEDVEGNQEEEETADQRSIRLEIFPCSAIPFAEEDSEN